MGVCVQVCLEVFVVVSVGERVRVWDGVRIVVGVPVSVRVSVGIIGGNVGVSVRWNNPFPENDFNSNSPTKTITSAPMKIHTSHFLQSL